MNRMKNIFRDGVNYKMFFAAVLTTSLAHGIYSGMQDNYLAEVVGLNEFDRGVTEFFRELPGLLIVLVFAVFFMFSAEKFYKISAAVMAIGLAMLGIISPTKLLVTFAICIFSLGEHIEMSMNSTISISYAKPGHGGTAQGYSGSFKQIGTLIGFVIIILSFSLLGDRQPFQVFFLIAAGIMLCGMFMAMRLTNSSETDENHRRFYFRSKFKKYYMLEMFYGARKQVFITFGPYVLILFYGASTAVISGLFALTAIIGFLMAPVVGRIIDYLGYKIVMIMDTLILVIVCFFYGFAHHLFPMNVAFIICCCNYVLDSVISMASMATNVYVQDISDDNNEVKATISTGMSVNHLITLFIALFGGLIWQKLGIETLFIISAVLGLCNSAYAATIKNPRSSRKGVTENRPQ